MFKNLSLGITVVFQASSPGILQVLNSWGLHARQAHETGICAVREELYAQCFEEVRGPCPAACHAIDTTFYSTANMYCWEA